MSPLDLVCRHCGAKVGERCSDDVIGEFQYTFHNVRIADASGRANAAVGDTGRGSQDVSRDR